MTLSEPSAENSSIPTTACARACAGDCQTVTDGRYQVLDGERAELSRELAVGARIEAEEDHVAARQRGSKIDAAAIAAVQKRSRVRLGDDRQP